MGPFGHTIFLSDGKWLLGDSYPELEDSQYLAFVNA